MDYYASQGVTTSSYAAAIKKTSSGTAYWWWLRSARSTNTSSFYAISNTGANSDSYDAYYTYGVSPAFRIA